MQAARLLNEKEVKEVLGVIRRNYACDVEHKLKRFLFIKTSKEKIRVLTPRAYELMRKLRKARQVMAGLYIGRLKRNAKIKLSLEGAQIVGEKAKKNVVTIDEKHLYDFLSGEDVEPKSAENCEVNNFVIVKCKGDVIGVGILRKKDDKFIIENLVPKARRLIYLKTA